MLIKVLVKDFQFFNFVCNSIIDGYPIFEVYNLNVFKGLSIEYVKFIKK